MGAYFVWYPHARVRTLIPVFIVPFFIVVPAGSLAVAMDQPLARLAFYLMEPRSDDGLVDWNLLDAALGADVKSYPIVRVR